MAEIIRAAARPVEFRKPLPRRPVVDGIILVGASGSGKSHWSLRHQFDFGPARLARPVRVVSQGAVRWLRCGASWVEVQEEMRRQARQAALQGLDVVLDGDFVRREWRQDIMNIPLPKGMRWRWTAWVFDVPLEVCLEQNEWRCVPAPPEAIRRQYRWLQSEPPHRREGFAAVFKPAWRKPEPVGEDEYLF